jgi:hypothetical protein
MTDEIHYISFRFFAPLCYAQNIIIFSRSVVKIKIFNDGLYQQPLKNHNLSFSDKYPGTSAVLP